MEGRETPFVALGSRLRGVSEVLTLGVRPNFHDYTPKERQLILSAEVVLYPTQNYAQFLHTMGKRIFPSLETYLYAGEKIKQTSLYYMLDLPHPRTRFYYHLHHQDITRDFSFPFVAKLPVASAQGRGVFLIASPDDLRSYLRKTDVAYIQEYLPHERDVRVIMINHRPILSYWRERACESFKTNIYQGGTISFAPVPTSVLRLAEDVSRKCRFDDVGLDFLEHGGRWYLIEANMKYGREGLRKKGMDLKRIIRDLLLSGEIAETVDRR